MRIFFSILVAGWLISLQTLGQTLPDFANVDVKNLSDQQVESLLRRSKSLGLSQNELLEMAQLQGLSLEDVQALQGRLQSFNSNRVVSGSDKRKAVGGRTINNTPDIFGTPCFPIRSEGPRLTFLGLRILALPLLFLLSQT